jgi:maleate cis-trans isomerase
MAFSSWRGIVGIIKPTMRPGGLEDMIRLLPEGIGVIPLFNNITRGDRSEFKEVMKDYDEKVAILAEQGCDLIHPEGAPPFMVMGNAGEAKKIKAWERKHKVKIFTSGTNHVAALKALKVKRFVGASYFSGEINDTFASYFKKEGFNVLGMEGIDVPFNQVQTLSTEQIYAFIKALALRHKNAQGIYMLGTGWKALKAIPMLEQDLGIPIVYPVTARVWEIQRRLSIYEPIDGYGAILSEMPEMVK